jgi:hypothetical protein
VRLIVAGLLLSLPAAALAQTAPAPTHPEAAFRRLELPSPNAIRTGSGEPGPCYWQ